MLLSLCSSLYLISLSDIEQQLRERLTKVGRQLFTDGLTHGSSGNISARIPGSRGIPRGFSQDEIGTEGIHIWPLDQKALFRTTGGRAHS